MQYFALTEFKAETAPAHIQANIKNLVDKILDPLRQATGKIIITSGYRTAEHNKKVGGATNSQHLTGEAVDFVCPDFPIEEAFAIISKRFDFDQLILEEKDGSKWVHVSLKRNRKETLICKDGKFQLK